MTKLDAVYITLGVLWGGNLIGFIYSLLVLNTNVFSKFRIQDKPYQKGIFKQRLPLILLNLLILSALSSSSVYFLFDFMVSSFVDPWIIAAQVVFVFFIDDIWFYFAHRFMHENKYILKKIHSIHHRAFMPFPMEYIYVHPFEWMLGIVGTSIGYAIIFVFMPLNIYSIWIFGILRNLHEVHIHSDLRIPVLKDMPLVSPVEDHDLHHARLDGNYASTFRIWDRVFKTRFVDKGQIK